MQSEFFGVGTNALNQGKDPKKLLEQLNELVRDSAVSIDKELTEEQSIKWETLSFQTLITSRIMPDSVTYPARFQLPSGNVDLLVLLGISAREADFVRTQGVEALLNLLNHHNFLPFTDPQRLSAV